MNDDIVAQVKSANPIQDVIEQTYPLQRQHGRYLRAREHDSLVVDTQKQMYTWNSKSESGDVIDWTINRNGYDFKTAVEQLCRRAHLPEPRWSREDNEKRVATRAKESAWEVALTVMQRWLLADTGALAYVQGRGWTDETIAEARLGFSGRGTTAAYEELRGEFGMHQIDLRSAAAVAVLGYRGDVRQWCAEQAITPSASWVEMGIVPGLLARTRLIYPHILFGKVQYFSGRHILGAEVTSEGKEWKSYNLPKDLVGGRQPFYNHAYLPKAEGVVIVEGQADAITLAQWGIAAVALAGTGWQDHEELLVGLAKRHAAVYLALDADQAGANALIGKNQDWPLARLLGPMARVITWGGE